MKTTLFVLLILFHCAPGLSHAAFFQWSDQDGVVHLTDDPKKIPKIYRDKAKRVEIPDPPRRPENAAPAPQAAPQASAPEPPAPGGHDERWWRNRFAALRQELETVQDARARKEEKLVLLQRERRIYHRTRDRKAVNDMQAALTADEFRIGELLSRLAELELEATRAGVPAEWLR